MTRRRSTLGPPVRRILAGLAAVTPCVLTPSAARADEKAVCAEAYHQAQVLRDDGKLVLARAQIAVCKAACPAHVSGDCEEWLGDVETRLASVVIVARDAAGNAVAAPRVVVDGKTADARAPIEVDPGVHVVRVEHAGTTVEKRVELAVGEKKAQVEVLFPGGVRDASAPGAELQPPSSTSSPRADPPAATWVLGLGGVALLGAAGVLTVHGHARRNELQDCSPRCAPDELDSIRSEWWVAAGLAGAGAVAVGAALVLWASAPASTSANAAAPRRATIILAPRAGGAAAVLRGAF